MLQRYALGALFFALTLIVACDQLPFAAAKEKGGPYLILEVDPASLRQQRLEGIADQMSDALRGAIPTIRYSGRGVLNDAARVRLVDPADQERALAAVQRLATPDASAPMLAFSVTDDHVIEARLTPAYLQGWSEQAAAASIEVLRRRVDPTGREGVEVTLQDDTRILLRAPRATDTNALRQSVGITGLMTFHIVREVGYEEAIASRIPAGTMVAQPYPPFSGSPEVVERRPRLTGEHVARVSAVMDPQMYMPVISFQLDAEGARTFCTLTRAYINQRFAILIDGQVLTAPRINEPICGGSGQISGSFDLEEANNLARILSAGALPASLTVVEEGVLPRE